jgi:3-oxoacyl-[acyl-carrier protein] reductase
MDYSEFGAFVTGASRSIGRECALMLDALGMRVAVGYREDKEGADETCRRVSNGTPVQIDVRDPSRVKEAVAEAERSIGPVCVLVNNAGMTKDKPLLRMSEEDWADVIETDLTGVFRCTKAALPTMIKRGWGRIVTIGSVVGTTGNPGQTNYAAAKAGVVGFTKALSREVGRYGVTVNVVAPGFVESALTASLPEKLKKSLLERTDVRRTAEPGEIAQAVKFCIESDYMTGSTVAVDGGMT